MEKCESEAPELKIITEGHKAACWNPEGSK
jgi:hypothetical protein